MIRTRRGPGEPVEELDLEELERRARSGELAPHHEICFPVVTGDHFVSARELELYRGLYASGLLTFRRYFHLARMPWATVSLIALLCGTYSLWQGGKPDSVEDLVRLGAKSPPLMVELGQWWRLVTANLLHVSGWHLAANAVFLFNLGGPAEAVFRRVDYLLVLVTSALAATAASTLVNPLVSCGASGLVFGVWGAAAVFGMRHRGLLPPRYRRYFIGGVLPYAIFALYLGLVMPGVDNWGHLGGLAGGSAAGLLLPPRLLAPKDATAPLKLAALGLLALLFAGSTWCATGPGELGHNRYYATGGLSVPVPSRWRSRSSQHQGNVESYAFDNGAGVGVGIQSRRESRPVVPADAGRRFVEEELGLQVEAAAVQGLRLFGPEPVQVAGVEAARVSVEMLTAGFVAEATYLVMGRGYYLHVVSLTAPTWLAAAYAPTFAEIAAAATFVDTDELARAREQLERGETAGGQARLALALAHAGEADEAWAALERAEARWEGHPDTAEVAARLLVDSDREPGRACALVRRAMETKAWTPELLALAAEAHLACDEAETARRILEAGVARFPRSEELQRRLGSGRWP